MWNLATIQRKSRKLTYHGTWPKLFLFEQCNIEQMDGIASISDYIEASNFIFFGLPLEFPLSTLLSYHLLIQAHSK